MILLHLQRLPVGRGIDAKDDLTLSCNVLDVYAISDAILKASFKYIICNLVRLNLPHFVHRCDFRIPIDQALALNIQMCEVAQGCEIRGLVHSCAILTALPAQIHEEAVGGRLDDLVVDLVQLHIQIGFQHKILVLQNHKFALLHNGGIGWQHGYKWIRGADLQLAVHLMLSIRDYERGSAHIWSAVLEHNTPIGNVILTEAVYKVARLVEGAIGAGHVYIVYVRMIGIHICIEVLQRRGIQSAYAVAHHMEDSLHGTAIGFIVVDQLDVHLHVGHKLQIRFIAGEYEQLEAVQRRFRIIMAIVDVVAEQLLQREQLNGRSQTRLLIVFAYQAMGRRHRDLELQALVDIEANLEMILRDQRSLALLHLHHLELLIVQLVRELCQWIEDDLQLANNIVTLRHGHHKLQVIHKARVAVMMRPIAYATLVDVQLGKRVHLLGRLTRTLHIDAAVLGRLGDLVDDTAWKAANGH